MSKYNLAIDVRDVMLLVTKDAVTGREFAKISPEEAEVLDDSVFLDIVNHYEKYFVSKEEVNQVIEKSQNFFVAVETAIYPPLDILNLEEKNKINVIYIVDDELPKRKDFEILIKSKIKGCKLLNSKDIGTLKNIDLVVSANEEILRGTDSKRKALMDMPYNKGISEFNRIKQWKEVIQIIAKDGLDMSTMPIERLT